LKKIFLFICAPLLAGYIIGQLNGSRHVEINAPTGAFVVSKKEKNHLEYFFRNLIIYDCGGYTLLGDKPVTFDYMIKPIFKWDIYYLWNAFLPSNLRKHNAWETFQKYQQFICGDNILIWVESSPWNSNVQFIMMANKKEISRIIDENKQDFQSFVLEDVKIKPLFKEILHSDEGLIGTVLGYGRDNSMLFRENRALLSKRGIFSDEMDRLFENKKAILNFTFGWPEVPMDEILLYPMFKVKMDSEETEILRSKYLKIRNEILEHYREKDFLEATLQLLSK
jgi:hypothetical protein